MNARDLIQQWERGANDTGAPPATRWEEGYAAAERAHAAELRAALSEQPLADKWREEADLLKQAARIADENDDERKREYALDTSKVLYECADDLDSHESELRERLAHSARRLLGLITILKDAGFPETAKDCKAEAAAIFRHLEGDSDEA